MVVHVLSKAFLVVSLLSIGASPRVEANEKEEKTKITADNITVTFKQDGKDVKILLRGNGNVSVLCDGSSLSGENLSLQADCVTVQSEEGAPLAVVDFEPDLAPFEPPKKDKPKKIGVQLQELDQALASQLQLTVDETLLIVEVKKGQPAAEAGLEKFDILLSIEEEPATQDRLGMVLSELEDGEELNVQVLRKGERHRVVLRPRTIDEKKKPLSVEWLLDPVSRAQLAVKYEPMRLKIEPFFNAKKGKLDLAITRAYTDMLLKAPQLKVREPQNMVPFNKIVPGSRKISLATVPKKPTRSEVLEELARIFEDVRSSLAKMEEVFKALEEDHSSKEAKKDLK